MTEIPSSAIRATLLNCSNGISRFSIGIDSNKFLC